MSITGKIMFANSLCNIFSGDDIKLMMEMEMQKEVFLKEIFLHFRGEVKVQWDDLINKNKEGKVIYVMQEFRGHQILVDKHISLQTMVLVNKGIYQCHVILNIPNKLPQSVSRKYGSVKYELELGLYNTQGIQILCTVPLNIRQYLNVCLHKDYFRPFHTVLRKSFCWGACNIQPIKLILTLPNTLFIAGDNISYFIKIENASKLLNIQRLSVILTQTHHYKAFKASAQLKQVHTSLHAVTHLCNKKRFTSKLEGSFPLPHSLVPTSSSSTCYLSTSYNLNFVVSFTGFHADGYISLPLIIGSHRDEKIGEFVLQERKLQMEYDKRTEYEV